MAKYVRRAIFSPYLYDLYFLTNRTSGAYKKSNFE